MTPHSIEIVPKRDDARALAPGLLAHLGDIDDDYMVADPTPDFRGWTVTLPDGRIAGSVGDIVVDTSTMRARYIEVKIDRDVLLGGEDRWALVPIESVRIEPDAMRIVVDRLPVPALADMPRRDRRLPTIEEQRAILEYFEIAPPGA